jgi:hypothetical protein
VQTGLLILLVLVPWSIYRQMQRSKISGAGLMKLPLTFVAIGLLGFDHWFPGNGGSWTVLAIGLLLSAGLGVWRGAKMPIWREHDGWYRQGNSLTLMLWIALIASKIVVDTIAGFIGIGEPVRPGEVFFTIGVSIAVQAVIEYRRSLGSETKAPVPAFQ